MLHLDRVSVRYGETLAVDTVDLQVARGEVVAIVGPSGCGKSSLLRAIAGLEPLAGGRIALDQRSIDRLPVHRRNVGLMFQDFALFPHRSVADNVAFGLHMRGDTPAVIAQRVKEVLDLVDLSGLGARTVTELSGGERQRVALARAVAPRPRLLMLDEPLGALDRPLQRRLLDELRPLLRELGTTTLYVTHDQDEALQIADRVAVMRAGRLVQLDQPSRLVTAPSDVFVARFFGAPLVLPAVADQRRITCALGIFPHGHARPATSDGTEDDQAVVGWIIVPSVAIRLTRERADGVDSEAGVTIPATVIEHRWLTTHCDVEVQPDWSTFDNISKPVRSADGALPTRMKLAWNEQDLPAPASRVEIHIDPARVTFVEGDA